MNRINKIQKNIQYKKYDALLISKSENVRYLCGFVGSNGQLLITEKTAYLITDFRYIRIAKQQIDKRIKIYDQAKGVADLLNKFKVIAIEQNFLSYRQVLRLRRLLSNTRLIDGSNQIEKLRSTKDIEEISIIKKAVDKANHVFMDFLKTIKLGQSQGDMEWNLLRLIKDYEGDCFSFDPIVAFGKETANVHHAKTNKVLKKGDQILIDFGLVYKGYMTDMTRMVYTKELTKKQKEIYNTVLEANKAAINAIEVGKMLKSIDQTARKIIEKAGYGKFFGHSTGHGVGLEIHEAPTVSFGSKELIKPGMVITIEPGIYTEKHGGVRIEDMVYINNKGLPEVLTGEVSKEINIISI